MDPSTKLSMYKTIHLVGIILSFTAMGAMATIAARGAEQRSKLPAIGHGVGLFLLLLGGFGMFAVMGKQGVIEGWPGWLVVKLLLWTFLGGAVALYKRKPDMAKATLGACIAAGSLASLLAFFKPF